MSDLTHQPLWQHLNKRWGAPSLDTAAVAGLLGITPATIRQYLVTDARFPAPEARGANGRNLWAPSTVYAHMRAYYPRRCDRIPRLWSPTDLNPGRFLGAQTVTPPPAPTAFRSGPPETFVMHRWRPSDGGGPIAIVYPLNTSRFNGRHQSAVDLYQELSPTVTAVAMPMGDASMVALPVGGVWQPAMLVVDSSTIDADKPYRQALEFGWYDVARLLQTDLPWWPGVLNDRDAMLAWQPGDPVKRVLPASGGFNPQPLLDLVSIAVPPMSPTLRGIVTDLADTIASELARSAMNEADLYPQYPGLVHAAIADADPDRPRLTRRAGDIALLLHHPVAHRSLADHALAVCAGDPVVTAAMTISPELAREPMVARWCEGLRPVAAERRDELGYQLLERLRPAENVPAKTVSQWCTHRNDPNLWAVVADDGTIHTTVGPAVPASGQLTSFIVTSTAGFFETSTGEAWPLPHKQGAGYNAGYDGSGPTDLAQTVSRLLLDAAADVDDTERVESDPRIWQLIHNQRLPIRWSA